MDKDGIRDAVFKILKNTFVIIDDCYVNHDEEISKGDYVANNSRLVFPCYSRSHRKTNWKKSKSKRGITRVSEQELRFIFIEQFIKYCSEKPGWNVFYSVETPTEWQYRFSKEGVNRPYRTDNPDSPVIINDNVIHGESGQMDVCIHDKNGKRICLIEFKAGTPDGEDYLKDFIKLSEEVSFERSLEGGNRIVADEPVCIFVHLLDKQSKKEGDTTESRIEKKIQDCINCKGEDGNMLYSPRELDAFKKIFYVRHVIEGNETKTTYPFDGWEEYDFWNKIKQ